MSKYKAMKTADFKEEKKKKSKKIKVPRERSEGETEVLRFICILVLMVALCVGIYFLAKNSSSNDENTTNEVEIQYDVISVGMILNRNYDNYYVLVYDFDNVDYSSLVSSYTGSKKLFSVDMSDPINKDYISDDGKSNANAQKATDFMFGKTTLLHIKDGKVSEYITNQEKIEKVLK